MRRQRAGAWSLVAALMVGLFGLSADGLPVPPGVVPASGCRTGALLSTDAFTSTGFSQTRTVGPNEEATAGAWVLADDFVPPTSVTPTPNCPPSGVDGNPLFVVALELTPTNVSWQDADIQSVKLVRDTNADGLYQPGTDFTLQSKPGSELAASGNVLFFNGPQSALLTIPSAGGAPALGAGAVAILAVVEVGPNPKNNSRFGLSLEALSADIPGGAPPGNVHSGFSGSRNQVGSSLRFRIVGGQSDGGGGGAIAQELRSYDQNGNDLIDDPEFFTIVDDWAQQELDNEVFFAAVDHWAQQTKIGQGTSATRSRVQTRLTSRGLQFAAPAASALSVEVYGLDGRRVFQSSSSGATLSWDLRSSTGEPVANGVYLYRASWRTAQGRTIRGDVRKLRVVR